MPFRPDRLKHLREVKGLSQEQLGDLAGLSHSAIAKNENGKTSPGSGVLEKLAQALDCTTDYLFGRGEYEHTVVELAASHMALDVFAAQDNLPEHVRQQCQRVLRHRDAPRTAQAWRSFTELIQLASAPRSISPDSVQELDRPPNSKPVAFARRRHH